MLRHVIIIVFCCLHGVAVMAQEPVITPKPAPIILKLNAKGKLLLNANDVATVENVNNEPVVSPSEFDCSSVGPQTVDVTATYEKGKLYEPNAVAFDRHGNMYIADSYNFVIKKIAVDGVVSIYLGNGKIDLIEGKGTDAGFGVITGLAFNDADELYMTDLTHKSVLKATADGYVSMFAKVGASNLQDIAWVKGTGNFIVSSPSIIYKLLPTGKTVVLAADYDEKAFMNDVALDSHGTIFFAETTQCVIKRINADGSQTIIAGDTRNRSLDGKGEKASFWHPWGLGIDKNDNLYVTESDGAYIRKITPDGTVTTVAGVGYKGAKDGKAREASFNSPVDVTVGPNGDLFVADYYNHSIRRITAGIVSRVNTSVATYVSSKQIPVIISTSPYFDKYADVTIRRGEGQSATLPDYTINPKVKNCCDVPLTIKQQPEPGTPLLPDVPVKVTLTADDGYGGTASVSFNVTLVIKPLISDLFVPSAFTPNADGRNDTWIIKGLNLFENAMVTIYNRYGNAVFKSRGYSQPFDGSMAGKQLPSGTYYYIIRPETYSETLSGSLSIFR